MGIKLSSYLLATILIQCYNIGVSQTEPLKENRNRSCWEIHDRSINKYADSLNFLPKNAPLPIFLEDYLMDWRLKDAMYNCLKNYNEKISFRKAIIDRINNENVLLLIINSKNTKLDMLYNPEILNKERGKAGSFDYFPKIKYMDKSWRALAEKRYKEINSRKR